MLTSDDQAKVAAAAEAIEHAAGMVRDLMEIPTADRAGLAQIQFQVADARRHLLESWSKLGGRR